MSILKPGRKKPADQLGMVQVNGRTGAAEKIIKGGERIFSRPHTRTFVTLAKEAKSEEDLRKLGREVFDALETQDKNGPEYTED